MVGKEHFNHSKLYARNRLLFAEILTFIHVTSYCYRSSGCVFLMLILLHPPLNAQDELKLWREILWDKMYVPWLGQRVGNIYGLPHEPMKNHSIRVIGDAGASDHWYSRKTWLHRSQS